VTWCIKGGTLGVRWEQAQDGPVTHLTAYGYNSERDWPYDDVADEDLECRAAFEVLELAPNACRVVARWLSGREHEDWPVYEGLLAELRQTLGGSQASSPTCEEVAQAFACGQTADSVTQSKRPAADPETGESGAKRFEDAALSAGERAPEEPPGKPGRRPFKDYDWAFQEVQKGRGFEAVFEEWEERDDVKARQYAADSDPRELLRQAIKTRRKKRKKLK